MGKFAEMLRFENGGTQLHLILPILCIVIFLVSAFFADNIILDQEHIFRSLNRNTEIPYDKLHTINAKDIASRYLYLATGTMYTIAMILGLFFYWWSILYGIRSFSLDPNPYFIKAGFRYLITIRWRVVRTILVWLIFSSLIFLLFFRWESYKSLSLFLFDKHIFFESIHQTHYLIPITFLDDLCIYIGPKWSYDFPLGQCMPYFDDKGDFSQFSVIKSGVIFTYSLGVFVPVLIILTFSSMLIRTTRQYPFHHHGSDFWKIEARRLTYVTYIASANIFLGVAQLFVWLRWPAAFFLGDKAKQIELLAFSAASFWGVVFTAMLLTSYLFVAWRLNLQGAKIEFRESIGPIFAVVSPIFSGTLINFAVNLMTLAEK